MSGPSPAHVRTSPVSLGPSSPVRTIPTRCQRLLIPYRRADTRSNAFPGTCHGEAWHAARTVNR
eukprot:59526-Hanusia_phi.AAC.2